MIRVLTRFGKTCIWAILALLHRAGFSKGINYLANCFEKSERGPFVRRRRAGVVQILAYHRVTHRPDSFLPSMPLPIFERHMECLARRFHVMDLSEAVGALERGSVPPNAVVVTFDDGYRDNFDVAYPVLAALSLPATIFLTTGVIGTDRVLWHDRVFRMFNETEAVVVPALGPWARDLPLDGAEQRSATRTRVLRHLRTLEPGERDAQIDRLEDEMGVPPSADGSRLMLDWTEVAEMQRGGVTFGAHTVNHPVLSRIPADRARREILESKLEIEDRVGTPVTTFAYPNGQPDDFDTVTKRLLEDAGFRCAVTTICGSNSSTGDAWDRFELRRDGLADASRARFEARMNFQRFLS